MKKYYLMYNIGAVKYVLNFHDGVSTHDDGSEFWDVLLSNNQKVIKRKIAELKAQGYKEGR